MPGVQEAGSWLTKTRQPSKIYPILMVADNPQLTTPTTPQTSAIDASTARFVYPIAIVVGLC